jgi:hypothetical protein
VASVSELDHVLIAVADLEDAAREFEARYGLASVEGGHHPGWGTANRIVPLGGAYLELVAIVDAQQAPHNPLGRWIGRAHPAPTALLGWVVRTDDLDPVARRLGLAPIPGSREPRDGNTLRWRLAGLEQAVAEPSLPFFIEWEEGTPFPGDVAVRHPAGAVEIARLDLTGDPDRLRSWLGDHRLPVTVSPGDPALRSVVLAGSGGDIVLE